MAELLSHKPSKDEVAARIAHEHLCIDSGVSIVIRLVDPAREDHPDEPIKLLEVYEFALPSGIDPIRFPPSPASGMHYATEFIQIAPEELDRIRENTLELPDGWTLGARYERPPVGAGDYQ